MIIEAKVITSAKHNLIKEIGKKKYKVYLTCIPEKGKANQSLIKLLAGHFEISKSSLNIIKGEFSSRKVIKVNTK